MISDNNKGKKMAEDDKRLSKEIMGKLVVSKTGKKFGAVGDVTFETKSGELIHLVLTNPTPYSTKLELESAKEYIRGNTKIELEDSSSLTSFFGEQALFYSKILTPDDYLKKIGQVNIKEILTAARTLFAQKNANLVIVGANKNSTNLKKVLEKIASIAPGGLITGWNVSFDWWFLDKAFRKFKMDFEIGIFCIRQI